MPVTSVAVQDFQSLADCSLELGAFTVIIGPSNSGKSAMGRALRTLARNVTGSGYVANGAKVATVTLTLSTGETVSVQRGKSLSTYSVTHPGVETASVYAKAGTSVPEDIAKLLGMPEITEGPDLHFTTQFDSPYLLDAIGSTASKVIGSLTNANTLAEAVREANRRRQDAVRMAKVRQEDSEQAAAEVRSRYSGLGARQEALRRAREDFDTAVEVQTRTAALQLCADRFGVSGQILDRLSEPVLDHTKLVELEEQLTATLARISELESLTQRAARAEELSLSAYAAVYSLESAAVEHEEQVHMLLKEVGQCPLCLQYVS